MASIAVECIPHKSVFSVVDQSQLLYLLVNLKTSQGEQIDRLPLNLSLVLDRSMSMAGLKMLNLKKAVEFIVDQLDAKDCISIITFDDQKEIVMPAQNILDKTRAKERIQRIDPGGGTVISAGLQAGLEELQKNISPEVVNRLILLTDGKTHGDEHICAELAQTASQQGISIDALGVGEDFQENLLQLIADISGGKAAYITTPEEIQPVFESEINSLHGIFIKDICLSCSFPAGSIPRRVTRVSPYISDITEKSVCSNNVNIGIIDGERGQKHSFLIELLLPPREKPGHELLEASVSYRLPSRQVINESVKSSLQIAYERESVGERDFNSIVEEVVQKVNIYRLQAMAEHEASTGNLKVAAQKMQTVATQLLDLKELELASIAMREAENINSDNRVTPGSIKKLHYGTRKLDRLTEMLPKNE